MKASDAAPDPNSNGTKPPAWKPSGALSNPDPNISDMSTEEYKALDGKSDFFRPAAKVPKMDGGHQCSLFEREYPEESFYQDTKAKCVGEMMGLPMLSVSGCMFICKCRCVCVLWIVHV